MQNHPTDSQIPDQNCNTIDNEFQSLIDSNCKSEKPRVVVTEKDSVEFRRCLRKPCSELGESVSRLLKSYHSALRI